MIITIIVVVIVVFLCLYNELLRLSTKCDISWSNLNDKLKKRNNILHKLIIITKNNMKDETDYLDNLLKEHSNNIKGIAKVSDDITKSSKRILLSKDKYKDNMDFNNEAIKLENINDSINKCIEEYNEAVKSYNYIVRIFPTNMFAKMLKYRVHQYFKVKD